MPTRVDRAELLQLIEDENAQIVYVLPEPEYTEAHLPGAEQSTTVPDVQ